MRRALSILLALWFGLLPAVPALPLAHADTLPACCRRDGAHHCAMNEEVVARLVSAELHEDVFSAPWHCPMYHHGERNAAQASAAIVPSRMEIPLAAAASRVNERRAGYRTAAFQRSRAGRAPPFSYSA